MNKRPRSWFMLSVLACSLAAFVPPAVSQPVLKTGHRPIIVLVGDSTVTDKAGWGRGFRLFLNDQALCTNAARSGRSSKSFIEQGLWSKALQIKGDYYLIQFGHNDERGKGPKLETDPNTTFVQYMSQYVDEARAIGATPVLVTSLVRRRFEKGGYHLHYDQLPYVEAVRKLAAAKKVPLIDLYARSAELCEKLGPEKCNELSPVTATNEYDTTHLNAQGGTVFGRLVAEDLRKVVPQLSPCLRQEPNAENPVAKPDGTH